MKISKKHIDALRAQEKFKFINRIEAYLLRTHPYVEVKLSNDNHCTVDTIPRSMLRSMVGGAVARAEKYGLTWESSITVFVVLMFIAAPNFDEHPRVQRILMRSQTDPNLRTDLLWEETSDEIWHSISVSYDAEHWSTSEFT